jgi:anaerobic magnesium-protoporphyrin IX monomethyl ester cyclase
MKVLLIAPKHLETSYHKISSWDEVGLGLRYLSSSLKREGFDVRVVLTDSEGVVKVLDEYRPDIVGITCVTATFNTAIEIIGAVKAYDETITTVMGGHHVTFTVEETLDEPAVDFVVRGEGEEVFPALLKNIMNNNPHALLDGVCFKKGNRVYNKDSIALVKDIDKLPLPDRSAEKSYDPPGIYILSSRGCPFKCTFCSASNLYGGKWRKRSVDNVLDELEGIEGIREGKLKVQFGDETVTVDTRWAKELCRGIIERGLRFKWYCNSRVDALDRDPELLPIMNESGCRGISLGIESGVQEIVDSFTKGINLEQAVRVADKLRDASLYQQWYLMVGAANEYDEPEYIKRSTEFMSRFPFDLLQISVLTPFPGTRVYEQLEEEGRLLHKNWDLYDGLHCVYRPLGMTVEELERELTLSYRQIYLQNGLRNIIRRTRHFRNSLANSRSFFTFLVLAIRVGIFKQDIRIALK